MKILETQVKRNGDKEVRIGLYGGITQGIESAYFDTDENIIVIY